MPDDASVGLSALEPGALPAPVGLDTVPVGPRVFLTSCALAAIALVPDLAGLSIQILAYLSLAALLGVLIHVFKSWRTVAWVIVSLLVVYSWAYPGSKDLVWVFGVQGFFVALQIALRLLAIVTVLYTMLLATGPLAIIQWAGDINEDLGIMISLTLSVIPVMKLQMDTTLDAQQARGLKTSGNVLAKLRAYLAVIIPVVVKSLVRAYGMAALLHTRGYGSGRRVQVKRGLTAASVLTYVAGTVWIIGAIAIRLVRS